VELISPPPRVLVFCSVALTLFRPMQDSNTPSGSVKGEVLGYVNDYCLKKSSESWSSLTFAMLNFTYS
jgi:hypothetical protein